MKRDYEKEFALAVGASQRFDAGETDFIVRQLLAVKAKLYQTEYPTLLARQFIPMASDVDAAAEAITWEMEDQIGEADFVSDYADDLPDVDVEIGEAAPTPVKTLAVQYGYSWLEMQRAARSKAPLPARRALRARRSIAEKIDVVLRSGNANAKLPGFLNASGITTDSAAHTYDAAGLVAGATPKSIAAEIDAELLSIETDTKGIHRATDVILPLTTYGFLDTTPWDSANATNVTLLGWLKAHHPDVNFSKWYALETAGAGSGKRAVIYEKNPDVVEGQLPLDFYEFAPQARGLGVKVPCLARVGGTLIRIPKAVRYLDGI